MKFFFFFFFFLPLPLFSLSSIETSCLWKIKNRFFSAEIQKTCGLIPGSLLNFFDEDGFSPLGYAIKNKDRETVEFLLARGENPDIRNRYWADAMHIAATFNATSIIPILKRAGSSVNSQDDEGNTPLMLASERGHLQAAEMLLRLGAAVDHRNQWNQSALSLASGAGFLEMVQFLALSGAKVQFFTFMDGRAPIHEAAISGHTDVLQFFLKEGVEVNLRSTYTGTTPLIYSILFENEKVFHKLLSTPGILVNSWDFQRRTPLYWAVKMKNVKMIQKLLSHGARVDIRDKNDVDARELAKNMGDLGIYKILLKFSSRY